MLFNIYIIQSYCVLNQHKVPLKSIKDDAVDDTGVKMPKLVKHWGALDVKNESRVGLHAVGGVSGLCLLVSVNGSKSWVYRTQYGGKRHKIGLGGYPTIPLTLARDKARQHALSISDGIDPLIKKREIKSRFIIEKMNAKTFDNCLSLYLPTKKFTNEKHGKQWERSLKLYASPYIGNLLVRDIQLSHIKEVLGPIWNTKGETARRVLDRIKAVIDFAIVHEYRTDKSNPATWKGYLDKIYTARNKTLEVEHMDALPPNELYDFMQSLRKHNEIGVKPLELLILTAVRSINIRKARWHQIDLEEKKWTIPAMDTKTKKKDHTVPLSTQAIELLQSLPRYPNTDLVFPNTKMQELSDVVLSKILLKMYRDKEYKTKAVPHGFRSTFAVWRIEQTTFPQELAELSLMHEVGNKVEQAYQRSDGFHRRVAIMQAWANFMNTPYSDIKEASNVTEVKFG